MPDYGGFVFDPEATRRIIEAMRKSEADGGRKPARANTTHNPPVWQIVKPTTADTGFWTGKLMLPDTTLGTLAESGDIEIYAAGGTVALNSFLCGRLAGINATNGKTVWIVGHGGTTDCDAVIDCVEAETGSLAEGCVEVVTDVACVDGSLVVTTTYLRGPGLSSSSTPCA